VRPGAYLARLRQIRSIGGQDFKTMDWISRGNELKRGKSRVEVDIFENGEKCCLRTLRLE
jgi:hypothetical protein